MSDRELLRLAAIACGELHGEWVGNDAYFDGVLSRWNPITDDGDALRLAVKVGMEFAADDEATHCAFAYARVRGAGDSHIFEPVVDDPCKAMRRAIVRAAAEIGRQHD